MSDRPLIDDTLLLLKITGFACFNPNLWTRTRKTIILFIVFTSYIDIIVYTIFNRNEPGALEGLFSIIGFTQVFVKMLMTALQSQNILKAISKMNEFWPIDEYGPQQAKVNRKIFTIIKSSIRSFMVFLSFILLLFCIKPYFDAEKKLPYPSYIFQSPELFHIGHCYEALQCNILLPLQLAFDFLYISLITNIICEFKLLKAAFAEILISRNSARDKDTMRVLKDLIDHHNVVLECSNYLKNICYTSFLCLFLTDMVGIGFCLLCIIQNGNFTDVIAVTYEFCVVFYVIQLYMYCFPGTLLILESTAVSDAVYKTDWWIKTQPELRRAYVMIMQRANRPVTLSAGGMMDVTLESFTSIMKNALSFFTFVQAMYNDN